MFDRKGNPSGVEQRISRRGFMAILVAVVGISGCSNPTVKKLKRNAERNIGTIKESLGGIDTTLPFPVEVNGNLIVDFPEDRLSKFLERCYPHLQEIDGGTSFTTDEFVKASLEFLLGSNKAAPFFLVSSPFASLVEVKESNKEAYNQALEYYKGSKGRQFYPLSGKMRFVGRNWIPAYLEGAEPDPPLNDWTRLLIGPGVNRDNWRVAILHELLHMTMERLRARNEDTETLTIGEKQFTLSPDALARYRAEKVLEVLTPKGSDGHRQLAKELLETSNGGQALLGRITAVLPDLTEWHMVGKCLIRSFMAHRLEEIAVDTILLNNRDQLQLSDAEVIELIKSTRQAIGRQGAEANNTGVLAQYAEMDLLAKVLQLSEGAQEGENGDFRTSLELLGRRLDAIRDKLTKIEKKLSEDTEGE